MRPPSKIQPYLEAGLQAHKQGRLQEAIAAYQHVLAVSPDQADALNLLGAALLQIEQPAHAVGFLERALRHRRNDPGLQGNLAQAYFALGRYEEAHVAFRRASRLDPAQVHFQVGVANSLAGQGKSSEAEALLTRLAGRYRNEPLVWFNLGNVKRDQRRREEAIASYRKALELDPRFLDARNNLGGELHALQRFEEAEREYRACLELDPESLVAQPNLASVLMDQGRFRDAEAVCRAMIAQIPDWDDAHTCLGSTLGHQGRLLEALACYRRVTGIAPDDPKATLTYARTLAECGFFGEAMRWFARILAPDPQSLEARRALTYMLLTEGCLGDGWAEYGTRPAMDTFNTKYGALALARKLPAEVRGLHVCLLREQGLGDEIFYLRYARMLHAAGARVSYRTNNKLLTLLRRTDFLDRVIEEDGDLPPADVVMMIADLPHALCDAPASSLRARALTGRMPVVGELPWRVSVFRPPVPETIRLAPGEAALAAVRERLARAGPPPYLGLTWRGGTPPREQGADVWLLFKEVGLADLAGAVKAFPGTLLGLQRKPAPGELDALSAAASKPVHDFTDLNEDLEAILALVAVIDDYVGVSNTNMHLRAAAGRTARVLAPRPAEWRWMQQGTSSAWFPGFTVYRQSLQGEWHAALTALADDLAAAFPRSRNGL
jgi:tetratricopeptide (TPR) repeat protein